MQTHYCNCRHSRIVIESLYSSTYESIRLIYVVVAANTSTLAPTTNEFT